MNKNKLKHRFEIGIKFKNVFNTIFGYVIYENGTILTSPIECATAFIPNNDVAISKLSKLTNMYSFMPNDKTEYDFEYTSEKIEEVSFPNRKSYIVLTHNMSVVNNTDFNELIKIRDKITTNIINDLSLGKPIFYFFRDGNEKIYKMYDVELNKYVDTSLNVKYIRKHIGTYVKDGHIWDKYEWVWENKQSSCSIM